MSKFKFTNSYLYFSTCTISFRCTPKEKWLLDLMRSGNSYSRLISDLIYNTFSQNNSLHKKLLRRFPDRDFDKLYSNYSNNN